MHCIARLLPLLLVPVLLVQCSQSHSHVEVSEEYRASVIEYRKEKNRQFKDSTQSPLADRYIEKFNGLNYYPFKEEYVVEALFVKNEHPDTFVMKTTGPKQPRYSTYGTLHFSLYGKDVTLKVYRNLKNKSSEEHKNYLFVPFTDQTSGDETYGGGRYLDLYIPLGDTVRLDFNKAYNPFCVYNYTEYDCPIPPVENRLPVPIEAGEKDYTLPK